MRNIEIKARIRDPEVAKAIARDIADPGTKKEIFQTDTYYNIAEGRLKLREHEGAMQHAELIFYSRPDTVAAKTSDYEIASITDVGQWKAFLAQSMGVRTVVRKSRVIFIHMNTRIHVDSVECLGSFIEFEVVLSPRTSEEQGKDYIDRYMAIFSINPEDLVDCSYCDLIDRSAPQV